MLVSLAAFAQTTIKGTVTSADKEALVGASVQVKGTLNGAVTDLDGHYELSNVPADAVLEFSFIGFTNKDVPVNGRAVVDAVLEESTEFLDEVVIIGYGAVKKSDLTSSISTVKEKMISEVTTGNAMDALQGKVNGVQVISGGGPGTAPQVLIRGVTTVNGSDPLYVVDGMPVGNNINFLNSNDIASMEVLKDASAAAIYGTRGSNGVILITTKKGQEGKAQFNFSTSTGFSTMRNPNMAKASEYEKVIKASYTNDGRVPIWNSKNDITDAEGTDWWNETVNKIAMVHNYTFNVAGGTEKLLYNLSLGYFRQDSQYDVGYWDKVNVRLNTQYTFNKYVKIGMDMAPRIESWEDTPDLFTSAMSMDPTTPVMRPEEEWSDNPFNNYQRSYNNEAWNPVAQLARADDHSRKYGFLFTPFIEITPVKGLSIRSQFGADYTMLRSDSFSPEFHIDALENEKLNQISRHMSETFNWNWTNTINYMGTFKNKHNINAMLGFTAEKFSNYWVTGVRDAIPNNSPNLHEVSAGTMNQASEGLSATNTLLSYIGRFMYNYDNRYYITATVRADGSSKFPEGNKYAVFPSISGAWRISNENFMQNQNFINSLKLRAGWGMVGNQSIPNSAFITLLGAYDAVFGEGEQSRVPGTGISSVGNKLLKWETVEDYNIGIDMSVLDSRLDLTLDFFQKRSRDMLYEKQNIFAVGYPNWNSTVVMNIGSMAATGWELSINWGDTVAEDFTYNLGVNLSGVKNKAIKLSGDGPILSGDFNSDMIIRNEDNAEIGRFYGYVADGLFQNQTEVNAHTDEHGNLIQPHAVPGDIRFKDLNHDGQLNEADKRYLGSAYPKLMMGLNMDFSYKNFDLTANFYGTFGNSIYNTNKDYYSAMHGDNVFAGTFEKAWHGEGTSFDIPRLSADSKNLNYERVSSFYIEDGSYFRCKLLQLGYTLPKKYMKDMSLRFTLSAQNLFTITKYSGMDPERPQLGESVLETGIDWIGYPNQRTFLFGIDFNF